MIIIIIIIIIIMHNVGRDIEANVFVVIPVL